MNEVDEKEECIDDDEEGYVEDCAMCSDFGTEMAFWC